MDIRYTLRYLAVPIKSKSYMFGDNRSVVTSATLPHSTLSKRHNILAFHRVREAIAAKIIDFHWIQSEYNLSDMLSKHWEHNKIFPMIQKFLITCDPITLIPRAATEKSPSYPNKTPTCTRHQTIINWTNCTNTQISNYPHKTHNNTCSYILLYILSQETHATSTIRGE